MSRHIACFEIPSLGIALARLRDPSLADRPIAVAPAASRACVQEVSEEARKDGVMAGMTVEAVRHLCPAIRLLRPDPIALRRADQEIRRIAGRFTPVCEPFLPGRLFLDLTGTTRLLGAAADAAAKIERAVADESGLSGGVGLGSSKLVARVASDLIPPSEIYEVWPGAERPFLAPLPVQILPGLRTLRDPAIPRLLDDLNLQTVGDLAETPREHLNLVFGRWGSIVSQWAHGIDPTPVRPPAEQPRLETSTTLDADEIDQGRLWRTIWTLLETLCRTMRREQRACRGVTLTLRYSDDVIAQRTAAMPVPSCWEHDLATALETLFMRLHTRRVRLRALTVAVERVRPIVHQLCLFPENGADAKQRDRAERLTTALDRVRARYGEHAIVRGFA